LVVLDKVAGVVGCCERRIVGVRLWVCMGFAGRTAFLVTLGAPPSDEGWLVNTGYASLAFGPSNVKPFKPLHRVGGRDLLLVLSDVVLG
jgi:hypothetical protein